MEKKKSTIERVVGAGPENEEVLLKHFKQIFDTRFLIKVGDQQIEASKSPELEQCIKDISSRMHEFLAEYDATALDIRPDQVHFIDKDKVPKDLLDQILPKDGTLASFNLDHQSISVFSSEGQGSKRSRAKTVSHEMIHFNSFASMQIRFTEGAEQGTIQNRRLGIQVQSGGLVHFSGLNEAVTEELAIRFAMKHFTDMAYTSEEVQKDLEKVQSDIVLLERILPESPNDYVRGVRKARIDELRSNAILGDSKSYPNEREYLYQMIDEIFKANKDQFKDKDDVFKLFVNAMLKGRLLPLARIIDKTYGRGSFSRLTDQVQILAKL
ncbi:MAG: hypothetical protein AAB638_02390 [Patescibacteria group bacterium]